MNAALNLSPEGRSANFKMESRVASSMPSEQEESIHMQLLEKALEKTMNKCVSSFKFSLLKHQFEPVYKKDPKTLHKLHQEASAELASNIKEELGVMFEEENIAGFMHRLDALKSQAQDWDKQLQAWRPSSVPSEDVRAHVHSVHLQHLHQLQKIFDQLHSQNTLLQRSVKKEEDKVVKSRALIKDHLHTWKQANCLTAEDCQEMQDFMQSL